MTLEAYSIQNFFFPRQLELLCDSPTFHFQFVLMNNYLLPFFFLSPCYLVHRSPITINLLANYQYKLILIVTHADN